MPLQLYVAARRPGDHALVVVVVVVVVVAATV
jgi:hypothetical protein